MAAKAGTEFGYALLLPLVDRIPVLYLVQEMTARLGVVTGRGYAELLRERYGFGWAAVAVISMAAIDLLRRLPVAAWTLVHDHLLAGSNRLQAWSRRNSPPCGSWWLGRSAGDVENCVHVLGL